MTALLLGSALAVLGLGWVLLPILRGVKPSAAPTLLGPLDAGPTALDTLREIEFDHATGKLAPEDYATLRAEFAPRAVAELEAQDAMHADADEAERLIARAKSRARHCSSCGPRPESDAIFCSDCGRYLASNCLRCGAKIDAERARFCTECGETLAA